MHQVPSDISSKSRVVALILAVILGIFGAQKFYLKKTKSAIVMLVLTLIGIGMIVTGPWALIDTIRILLGGFRDGDGKRVFYWTEPQSLAPPAQ